MWNEIASPGDSARLKPATNKIVAAMFGQHLIYQSMVGLGGSSGEGKRDLAKTEFEQAIAAARLAIIVPLGRGTCDYLDLAIVQAKASIDCHDLRFDGAIVGKQYPRRTALNDGGCNRGAINIGKRLRGEHDRDVLLAKGLEPLPQLAREVAMIKREPSLVDDQ